MDRVPADEVRRVDHSVRVRSRCLAVEAEAAEDGRRGRLSGRHVVHAVWLPAVREHEHLPGPVELDVLAVGTRVRMAQLERAFAAEDHCVDGRRCVTVAAHPVCFAESVNRVRGQAVEVARDGRREAELQEPALEQRDLRAACALARLPVDDLDRLAASPEGHLRTARAVLHHQPHWTGIADLEAEFVPPAAAYGAAYLLARLTAANRIQRENFAADV